MKIHYRDQGIGVPCNRAASEKLVSTQEPVHVTCAHCKRALRRGIQQELFK